MSSLCFWFVYFTLDAAYKVKAVSIKDYFNQLTVCKATVCWSKYTTNWIYFFWFDCVFFLLLNPFVSFLNISTICFSLSLSLSSVSRQLKLMHSRCPDPFLDLSLFLTHTHTLHLFHLAHTHTHTP